MAHLPHLHASCSTAALLGEPLPAIWERTPDKASDNLTVQNFRKDCLRELKKIKLAWPELNYSTAPGVLILHALGHRPSLRHPTRRASWNSPFLALGSPLTASTGRFWTLLPPLHFLSRPERASRLFPQACVNRGTFPRAFTTHTVRAFTTLFPSNLRAFTTHLHIVRTSS